MLCSKKCLYALFTFITLPMFTFANIENDVEPTSITRSTQHQHSQKISILEEKVTNITSTNNALAINDLAIYTLLINGIVEKIITFDADVTITAGNQFQVSNPEEGFSVTASTSSPVVITAGSHSGITSSDTLSTPGGSPNSINTNTIINGSFTVSSDVTINGNLIVNGSVSIDSGVTLTVEGALIFDGQCINGNTCINNGIITVDGSITIQNYLNSTDAVINNTGATITSTSTTPYKNTIMFRNNVSTDDVAVKNIGASTTITTAGDIIFESNQGNDQAVYNTTDARIYTTSTGSIIFKDNYSSSGIAVCNNGMSASIDTVDGDILIKDNEGNIAALSNMDSAVITSTNKGFIYIKNNYSKSGIAVHNTGTSTKIETTTGNIVIEGNRGTTTAVSNMSEATINVATMGSIFIQHNHSSGAHGLLNDNATITSETDGCIIIEKNSGETTGVTNTNNTTSGISASGPITFNSNKGINDTGVHNNNAQISTSGAESFILFKDNTGQDYGVRNNSTSGGNTNIRTLDTTSPNNKTKILFIGNIGGISDTDNDDGTTGTANIITSGMSCYDNQRKLTITTPLGTVSPEPRVCATDEFFQAGVIEATTATNTTSKTIVFDPNVDVTLTPAGTLSLNGVNNGLSVLAHTSDKAEIELINTTDDINANTFPNLTLTTGSTQNQFSGNIIINGTFTVWSNLEINGNLTVKGSVEVKSGATLNVDGDIIFDGQNISNQSVLNNGTIQAHNITMRNMRGSSPAVCINNPIEATGFILFENNTGMGNVDNGAGVRIEVLTTLSTPLVKAEKGITFKNNTSDTNGIAGTGVALISDDTLLNTAPLIQARTGNILFSQNSGGSPSIGSGGPGIFIVYNSTNSDVTAVQTLSGDIIFDSNAGGNSTSNFAGDAIVINPATNDKYMIEALGGGSVICTNNVGGNTVNSGINGRALYLFDSAVTGNAIKADHDIKFINNRGGTGPGSNTRHAITISGSAILTMHNDIRFESNSGSNGNDNTTGSNGGKCIDITATSPITAGHKIFFANNKGGNGGNGTAGDGGNGEVAIFIDSGISITASSDTIFKDNIGGSGGNATGNNGNGAHGTDLDGTITTPTGMFFLNNTGGAVGTGGAGGTDGIGVDSTGTIRSKNLHVDSNDITQQADFTGNEYYYYDASDATAISVSGGTAFLRISGTGIVNGITA